MTVIIIFSVEPERQQELVDTTVDFLSTVKQQPGFISSSINKSTDGNKFANYAQWRSLENYQAFVNNSDMQAKGILDAAKKTTSRRAGKRNRPFLSWSAPSLASLREIHRIDTD
ncbi:MAG: hypothetical protein BRC51_01585 [Cyanobacteria bacterium SW_12_48_29]|nr:MAG: hypothetical protein BRC51_01585 [Cyanobacteria bacterium SW_12_48_29]